MIELLVCIGCLYMFFAGAITGILIERCMRSGARVAEDAAEAARRK